MIRIKLLLTIGVMLFILTACSNSAASKISEWEVPDTAFPLAEPGPYYVGYQEYTVVDESRSGREIELAIWYPAKEQTDALSMHDAPVYKREVPYPMILTDGATGSELIEEHLATHGFAMVEVRSPDEYAKWDFGVIDHPRDMLFALDQIATNPPEGLAGAMDTDHVGVTGYSWGALYSLAVSGARVDPDFYQAQCADAEPDDPLPESWWIDYICNLTGQWDAFVDNAGPELTTSTDGLWQPLTDERIRAVMPMAPEGAWLFGERGLAAVDRPTLIIGATADDNNYYDFEAVYTYEHLGTPDRYLVSFVDQSHFMAEKPEQVKRMNHFLTAFFGYYLQGREDFAEYFSEDYVAQFDDLAWGVYEGE